MLPDFSGQWCDSSSRVIIGHTTVEEWNTNLSRSVEYQLPRNVAQYHSRQHTPNTSLQKLLTTRTNMSGWFSLANTRQQEARQMVCLTSVMTVPSGCDNLTRGMVTTAFPQRFRQHVKKRKRKVKIQYEQKRFDLKLWTSWRNTHNLRRRSLLSEHRTA
jgi:hypothetical protein